jgi:hypothetical protein
MNYEFNTHQFASSPVHQFTDLFPPSAENYFSVSVNENNFTQKNC